MIPEEALSIYTDLRELLEANGFTWVLENVDELLRNGVPQQDTLARYREVLEGEDPARPRRERRETVIGMRPHTEQEQLTLLLDEIERCLIHPLRITDALPKSLSPPDTLLHGIDLVDNNTNQTVLHIDASRSVGGKHVGQLERAVEQIRRTL